MRYYGYYAWLSSVYARRKGDTNPKTWQRFVRRAEALYALTAQQRGGETGIAGILWAQAKLGATDTVEIAFAEDSEPGSPTHYLKQAWGAYGAAYAGQLFEIGIFSEVRAHSLPAPSRGVGEDLAACFEAECGGLVERYLDAIERGVVRRDDLDRFAPLTPSGIRVNSEERQLYEQLLFAELGINRPADQNRRRTLLLILEMARQLGRSPDVTDIRWTLYSGYLPDGSALAIDERLREHWKRWWVYQVNDLFHICFEVLLKYLLDKLEIYPGGLPVNELIGNSVADILSSAEVRPENWAHLLELMPPADNASSRALHTAEYRLAGELMKTTRPEQQCGPETAWIALKLLAVLHNRVCAAEVAALRELAEFGDGAFRSAVTETRFLELHLKTPFEDIVAEIMENRVLRRHLWIALRKLRYQNDYTFLIEADNGRIRLRDKDGPVFTNPRLGPAVSFLRDVHLLGASGLTLLGERRMGAV
jgi:hypothetical protein